MRLLLGMVLGSLGYAVWQLSEPEPGQRGDLQARLERLQQEWNAALAQGQAAGTQTRQRMESDFEAATSHPARP